MQYLVTGGTGFIGRFVVERLLQREGAVVHMLVRQNSADKFEALRQRLGASAKQLKPLWGDITQAGLTDEKTAKALRGKIDHVFHLAAVYDMNMDDATGDRINNEGTRNVVNFVNDLGGDVRLQHVSSVAVAGGKWVGNFSEKHFDEDQDVSHPYFRTKFQSEQIVRDECKQPWRVYRPGAVVGSSETGEMDKVDGPYYLFPMIQRISSAIPKWLPLLGIEGGQMPLAPVDYVADAMVAIAHVDGQDHKAFHLLQRPQDSVGRMLEIFFGAAHGPGFASKMNLPEAVRSAPASAVAAQAARALGIPPAVLDYVTNRAVFDDAQTQAALAGTGISCPPLKDYAPKLWEYWETHLDYPEPNSKNAARVAGKVVMVTGASSGIGLATAKKFATSGATVILVARTEHKLQAIANSIRAQGGDAHAYAADLTSLESIDALAEKVLAERGRVDILVNNAGRSIRRAVWESLDRFHDYERTMQLNYFACVRLINALLPTMRANREGQIINISSIGCLSNAPRFAAYVASKSALDAFSRCIAAEVKPWNIDVTSIYMPLVRTPMIAPTKIYDYVPTWSVDEASDLVMKAAVEKSKRLKTPLGQTAEISYAIWPKINDTMLSKVYQLFPSSVAAKGKAAPETEKPTKAGIALAWLLRGSHV